MYAFVVSVSSMNRNNGRRQVESNDKSKATIRCVRDVYSFVEAQQATRYGITDGLV